MTRVRRQTGPNTHEWVEVPDLPAPRAAPAPCRHLGQRLRVLDCEACGGVKGRPVHACAVHGECSPDGRLVSGGKSYTTCAACRVGRKGYEPAPAAPRNWRWISTARLTRDAVRLAALLPPDVAGVVGVPRSGMLPAGVIATHLHLPLYELTASGPRPVAAGSRGGTLYRQGARLAVCDDTIYGGGAMARARKAMGGRPAVYCAVYVRPEARSSADLCAVELESPHVLEWNVLCNGPAVGLSSDPSWRGGVGLDFDGVIAHDAHSGGAAGAPYLLPRSHAIKLIATGRPESARAETEAWLRRWGVKWRRLEMLPAGADPNDAAAIAAHKAGHYGPSGLGLFIESDPAQAAAIHAATSLPVACPLAERVWA